MRRMWIIGLVLIVALFDSVRVPAQSGTLADIIDSRDELSVLSAFLDAAPTIRDKLDSSVSYTVFAPDNTAFANLASTLDVPLAELIRSPEVVTALLDYHIITGIETVRDLRTRDGQIIPTELFGAFIGLRVDDDGALTVNNVVQIVTPNIGASNGILHVVDDVLLNRVIDDIIDTIDLQGLITPNIPLASPSPTVTSIVRTPTAQPTVARVPVSNLRLAHLALEQPAVDLYLSDERRIIALTPGEISSFVSLVPGIYTLELVLSDAPIAEGLILSEDITLLDGDFVTVVVRGGVGDAPLTLDVLDEDVTTMPEGASRLVLVHALAEDETLTVLAGEERLMLASGAVRQRDLPFGQYDLRVDAGDTSLVQDERLQLLDGAYHLVALAGTRDAPRLVQTVVSGDEAADLRQGTALQDDRPRPTAPVDADRNVLDILQASDDFEILLTTLEIAGLLDTLSDEQAGITLLAPTDAAFADLLATLDISQERLFADQTLLTQILRYHLIEAPVTAADFRAGAGTSIVTALQPNQAFTVSVNNAGTIFLNGRVRFSVFDLIASNGVVHIIEDVLLPQVALDAFGL